MAWIFLFIASLGEIFGVMGIQVYIKKRSIGKLLFIMLSFTFGFVFLSLSMRDIPLGTAYAVWTGLGAAGAVFIGIIFFNESANWKRILFLFCIITGAIGLKLFE